MLFVTGHSGKQYIVKKSEKSCIHGKDIAVGRFKTSNGCVVFPDAIEQDLCVQHIMTDGFPDGEIIPVLIYQPLLWNLVKSRF